VTRWIGSFIFKCMGNLLIFEAFVNMTKILFTRAKANLIVNKNLFKALKLNLTHSVKVPFGSLFLPIVDETFNTTTKEDQKKGGCKASHFRCLRTIIHNTIHGQHQFYSKSFSYQIILRWFKCLVYFVKLLVSRSTILSKWPSR
jgi:hypothetical protein